MVVALACGEMQSEATKEPPPAPTNSCGGASNVETFAIDVIDLGEDDWQTLGYDLDGKITTKDSVDVCTGAVRTNQIDGDRGIDNAFGALVMPTLESSLQDPTPSPAITSAIASGRFTLQIQVTHLDDTPTQTCAGITAQIFASDRYDGATAPAFDATTDWPTLPNPAVFNAGYVQMGTVVLGANGGTTVPLHLVLENGNAFDLLIHQAIITFDHPSASEASNGVIAGVLDPEELMLAAEHGFPYPKACCVTDGCGNGWISTFQGWSDILKGRTNSPGVPCNAISFAIGFHARRVASPTKLAAPLPPPPPPCP